MTLQRQFAYIIDNRCGGQEQLGDTVLEVYNPEKLQDETECIVILTSIVYMYDMYCQLNEMQLSEEIECYAFPFMQMVTPVDIDENLLKEVINKGKEPKIPKLIHCFWFSGEEKPEAYKRCVDTWAKHLPDYEIIEWNMDNYDWHKHPFVERAIELKAWAFASDYARLDVLYHYGGIYLDMDVEVFKSFDDLLGNDALFSFGSNVFIDLAVMGAKKHNPIILELLRTYDSVNLPKERKEYVSLFQPALVRQFFAGQGIRMDGSMQKINDATIFPREFFMPLDAIIYRDFDCTDHTYCVHYDNFGWSFDANNKNEKKRHDNNLLWNMIEEKCD